MRAAEATNRQRWQTETRRPTGLSCDRGKAKRRLHRLATWSGLPKQLNIDRSIVFWTGNCLLLTTSLTVNCPFALTSQNRITGQGFQKCSRKCKPKSACVKTAVLRPLEKHCHSKWYLDYIIYLLIYCFTLPWF